MSISTPDSNSGKEQGRETSKENAAGPRPSARRRRTAAGSATSPVVDESNTDETVDGAEAAQAQATAEDVQSSADSGKDDPAAAGGDRDTPSEPVTDDDALEVVDHDDAREDTAADSAHESVETTSDLAEQDADATAEIADADDDTDTDDSDDGTAEIDADDADIAADKSYGEDAAEDDAAEDVDAAPVKAPKPDRFDPTPTAQQGARSGAFGVLGSGDTSGFGGLQIHAGSGIPSRSSERPYGGYFDEVAERFAKSYPQWRQALIATVVDRGEMTFYVEKSHIARIMKVARDDAELRFELLSSVSGVDYFRGDAGMSSSGDPKQDEYAIQRLHVVYHLLSMTFRRRVRFEVATTIEDPHVPSVSEIYPTADWQERETFDMFGVVFDGHHALTRILMPDDWDGFPQRKDYPLGGIPVEYHDATIPPPDERRAYK